jgi:hypothetical protein
VIFSPVRVTYFWSLASQGAKNQYKSRCPDFRQGNGFLMCFGGATGRSESALHVGASHMSQELRLEFEESFFMNQRHVGSLQYGYD